MYVCCPKGQHIFLLIKNAKTSFIRQDNRVRDRNGYPGIAMPATTLFYYAIVSL